MLRASSTAGTIGWIMSPMTPGKVAFFSTTSTAAATAPQASCPSTTTSGQPSTPTPYSTLPSAATFTVLPALRMMNSSPRPRPNSSSGGTRLSEQPTSTQKGAWPRASSIRRSRPCTPRKGASMRKFSLPSFRRLERLVRRERGAGHGGIGRQAGAVGAMPAAAQPSATAAAAPRKARRPGRWRSQSQNCMTFLPLQARRNARAPAGGAITTARGGVQPGPPCITPRGSGSCLNPRGGHEPAPSSGASSAGGDVAAEAVVHDSPRPGALSNRRREPNRGRDNFGGMNTATTHPARTCRRRGRSRRRPRSPSGCARPERERSPVRDRVRAVRAAAYRHLRRGRAHDLGAERLHAADRRPAVAPARLQRRHGRAAQGAGQRAEPGHAGGAPRQAAHRHPRPVRHA